MPFPSTSLSENRRQALGVLISGSQLDKFCGTVREHQFLELPPPELAMEAALALAPMVWQENYGYHLNHGLLGLASAVRAGAYLEAPERIIPVMQQIWQAGFARKSPPIAVTGPAVPGGEGQEKDLAGAMESGDWKELCGILASVWGTPSAQKVRQRLFTRAFRDVPSLGHKAISLAASWEFAEGLRAEEAVKILFPAVHYLVEAPGDTELADFLAARLKKFLPDGARFLANTERLGPEEAARLERVVLYQYPGLILENWIYALRQGVAAEELFQVSLLAACDALHASHAEDWLYAVHGYHFAHYAWDFFGRTDSEEAKIQLPFLAAFFVNKMARKGVNPYPRLAGEETVSPEEFSLSGLERIVRSSHAGKTRAVVEHLLAGGEFAGLARILVLAAAKNDGEIASGHDLEMCDHALSDYGRFTVPGRERLIVTLACFLAGLEKDDDFYTALFEDSKPA